MADRWKKLFVVAAGCSLLLISSTAVWAAEPIVVGDSVRMTIHPNGISWQADVGYAAAVLTISGPDGSVVRKEFGSEDQVAFSVGDDAIAATGDGQFGWELQLSPVMNEKEKAALEVARAQGGLSADGELKTMGRLPDALPSVSGFFVIKSGSIVMSPAAETASRSTTTRVSPTADGGDSVATDMDDVTKDQVILDDLIVDGSVCAGFDCVNGENFGFDTLRLKENNLRIKFQDTSNSSSFPTTDWQLTANDSANGGANKFSIDDIDSGRTPFTVLGGANSNALFVSTSGRIGFGTSTPVVELHTVDGDTPTLRLEQNGSFGWFPQTWDVAANETNFFIRDATNGSKLPFRIRPNAPSNSLYIDSDGDIGLGTASPDASFHIQESTGALTTMMRLSNNNGVQLLLENTAAGAAPWNLAVFGNSFVISRPGSGGNELEIVNNGTFRFRNGGTLLMEISNTGDVNSASGVFGSLSDRNAKNNLLPVNGADVLGRIASLPILEWSYSHQPASVRHIGPMAQDFFNAFGLFGSNKMIAITDLAGVALAGIKELNAIMVRKDGELAELKAENAALATSVETLQDENAALKSRLDRIERLLLSPDGDE